MNALSIGPLAIGLICLYIGCYHLWFYRKVPTLKENLYFSLSAIAVGFYGFFCSMLYQTTEAPRLSVFLNRLQISSLILFCPAILYFVYTFVGRKIGRWHRLCFRLALICTPITLFSEWIFGWETHTVFVPFPRTEFLEGNPGPGAYVFAVSVFAVLVCSTILLLKGLKEEKHRAQPVLVACLMFYPMILNDTLILFEVYQSAYLIEYGFLIIVLGAAFTLAERFFSVHERVEALNKSLREKTLQIRASEERYRALFEAAKEGIVLFSRDGQILLANPHMLSLMGMPSPSNGLPSLQQLFQRDYTEIEVAMQALADGTKERFDMEAELMPPGGSARSVSLGISLLERRSDEALFQGIARDTTEQKAWMKKILHQDKMSSLGVLAGGVSHEFNNFLASISGFAQLAQVAKKSEDVQRATQMIVEQAERATQVAQNLLRFAGSSQSASREEIDLGTLLDRSLMLVEKELTRAGIRITRDYAEAPLVASSAVSLEQVLVNLYLNARDAMEEGGTMTVRVTADEHRFAIMVEDTGPGIPPQDLHRIFEPFYTTKGAIGQGKRKGTGLGLAISHGLVHELGGEIRAENLPDGGSRFTVLLPLTHARPEATACRARTVPI